MAINKKIGFWDVIAMLCVANWIFFFSISMYLGGDAFGAKVENGKYYVSSHGRLKQVSKEAFQFSQFQGYTAFAGLGLLFLIAGTRIFGHAVRKDVLEHEKPAR